MCASFSLFLKLVAGRFSHVYPYSSSTKPSSVITGQVGTYYSEMGKARECLQRTGQRVLLLTGLNVADTDSLNQNSVTSMHIN